MESEKNLNNMKREASTDHPIGKGWVNAKIG